MQVNEFTYLGKTITKDARFQIDKRRRRTMTNRIFEKHTLLPTDNIECELNTRIAQTHFWHEAL